MSEQLIQRLFWGFGAACALLLAVVLIQELSLPGETEQPASPPPQLVETVKLIDAAELVKAKEDLEQLIAEQPDLAVAHYQLGRTLSGLGDYALGIEAVRKAVALEPGNVQIRLFLADLYNYLGMHDDTAQALSAALDIEPDNLRALLQRFETYIVMGRLDLAVSDIQFAIATYPDNDELRLEYGRVQLMANDFEGGREILEPMLKHQDKGIAEHAKSLLDSADQQLLFQQQQRERQQQLQQQLLLQQQQQIIQQQQQRQ